MVPPQIRTTSTNHRTNDSIFAKSTATLTIATAPILKPFRERDFRRFRSQAGSTEAPLPPREFARSSAASAHSLSRYPPGYGPFPYPSPPWPPQRRRWGPPADRRERESHNPASIHPRRSDQRWHAPPRSSFPH